MTESDAFDALRQKLLAEESGSIRVHEVQVEQRYEPDGEERILVNLVVSEPPDGGQTWSLEDAFLIRQAARQAAIDLGFRSTVTVTMTMEGAAETDDRDDEEGSEVGGNPEGSE